MPLSPEDRFARHQGFADTAELKACRDASLSQSQASPDNDPTWKAGPGDGFVRRPVSKTPSDVA